MTTLLMISYLLLSLFFSGYLFCRLYDCFLGKRFHLTLPKAAGCVVLSIFLMSLGWYLRTAMLLRSYLWYEIVTLLAVTVVAAAVAALVADSRPYRGRKKCSYRVKIEIRRPNTVDEDEFSYYNGNKGA